MCGTFGGRGGRSSSINVGGPFAGPGMLLQQTQGGSSGVESGFDFFVGSEGALTAGRKNFAAELKNGIGFDFKRDAADWRFSSNSKYAGSKPKSPNLATIDRTSLAFGYGSTIQKNKDIVNGVAVFTESYSVGWEMFGVQTNFDGKGNVTDIRFGFDSGVSFAFFLGFEFSFQLGGIYVFEK